MSDKSFTDADIRTLRRADIILSELTRQGVTLLPGSEGFQIIRRLHGWTGTLLRHSARDHDRLLAGREGNQP